VHAAPRTPAAGVLPGMPPAAPPAAAGVGITFRQLAEGGFVVVKVASGGPSDRQGVQPGDILTKVDRQEVRAHAFSRSPAHAVAARARSMHRPRRVLAGAVAAAGARQRRARADARQPLLAAHDPCPTPCRARQVLQFSFERLAHLLAGPFGSVVSLTFVRKRLVRKRCLRLCGAAALRRRASASLPRSAGSLGRHGCLLLQLQQRCP